MNNVYKRYASEEWVEEKLNNDIPDSLTIDLTDTEQGTATGINADTLGGKAASEYVSVTDFDSYKNDVSSEYATKNSVQTGLDQITTNVQAEFNQITTNTQTELNQLAEYVVSTYQKKTDVAVDSNKLGGVAASEYALKTDTAPNSEMLGGIAASEYAKQADLTNTTIGIKSTTTGSVAYNYSCIINGVKLISIKATGVTISSGQSPVLCTLNTSFSSEVPISISTNSSVVCGGWIRSNGEIVVKPNSGSLSNADVRIVGIGW